MHEDARAEAAILSSAEAYRLVEEARQMREERDAALAEIERLKAALREADRWLLQYHNIQAARDTIRLELGEY